MAFEARKVQQRLKDAGWLHDKVDGDFGRKSWSALLSSVAQRELGDRGLAIGEACVIACKLADITSPLRIAHFVSQTATETGGFRTLTENLNYSAKGLMKVWPKRFPTEASTAGFAMNPVALANKVYGGRLGNGPASSNDGWTYRGRGLIQLTGRDNYTKRAAETGLPLVAQPDMASDPRDSVRIACLYWSSRSINEAADTDDIVKVRKLVNGGEHGLADARIFLKRAKAMLVG